MSQFENPGRVANVLRRRRGVQDLSVGIDQTLNAPGVVAVPLTEGQTAASELAKVLGLTNVIANDVTQINRQAQHEAERETNELDREAEKKQAELDRALEKKHREIELADRGQARLSAGTFLPEIERQIESGELLPEPGQSDEDFARSIIAPRGEGLSEAFKTELEESAVPNLMRARARRREVLRAEAIDQNQKLMLASVGGMATAKSLEDAVVQLRSNNSKLSDGAARALVFSEAAQAAEAMGGKDGAKWLEAAEAILPDGFLTAERQAARDRLKAGDIRKKTEASNKARSELEARLGRGEPIESVYADALKLDKSGVLDGSDLLAFQSKYENDRSAASTKAKKALAAAEFDQEYSKLRALTSMFMLNGAQTGGAIALPLEDTIKITLSDGSVENVNRKDLVNGIAAERMWQIAATSPDPLPEQVDYMTTQSGGATYQPWMSSLNGIAGQVLRADMTAETVPQTAVESLELYERFDAMKARGILDTHLKNDQSRSVLRLANALKIHGRGGPGDGAGGLTSAQALAEVAQLPPENIGRFRSFKTDSDMFRDKVDVVMGELGDVENREDIEQVLADKAGIYQALSGIGEEAALERAGKDILEDMRVIDGRATFFRGRDLPPDLDGIVDDLKAQFAEEMGDKLGLKATNLRFQFDPLSGIGTLKLKDEKTTPEKAPAVTQADLQRISQWSNNLKYADERMRLASKARPQGTGLFASTGGAAILAQFLLPGKQPTAEAKAGAERFVKQAETIPQGLTPGAKKLAEYIVRNRRKPKQRGNSAFDTFAGRLGEEER